MVATWPFFLFVWMEIFVSYLRIWFFLQGTYHMFRLLWSRKPQTPSHFYFEAISCWQTLESVVVCGDHQTDDDNLYHCWYNPAGGSFEILRGMIPFIICSLFGIFFCLLVFNWQKLDTLSTRFLSRFYGLSNRSNYRCT